MKTITRIFITDLSPKEAEAMRKRVKTAAYGLRACEARLQRYLAGEDNVLKTAADLRFLEVVVKGLLREID